jgi:hypothetical protein
MADEPEPAPAPEPAIELPPPAVITMPFLVPQAQASDIDAAQDRIAALETRLEEQEAILRRVLTLLVDWAERDLPPAWSPEAERRSGKDRRFHAV